MDKKYEKPTVYTSIYWLIQDKKIETEMVFNFSKFFWPSFISKNKHVFLKEKFSKEEYNRLISEKANPEYWINLLVIDQFFLEDINYEEKSIDFSKILIEIWQQKLKKDLPEKKFKFEILHDKEFGDYCITFYQIQNDKNANVSVFLGEIPTPYIKENKMKQFHKTPRLGMPEIRKPSPSEIPK